MYDVALLKMDSPTNNFKGCVRYFLKIHYSSDLITYMKLQ